MGQKGISGIALLTMIGILLFRVDVDANERLPYRIVADVVQGDATIRQHRIARVHAPVGDDEEMRILWQRAADGAWLARARGGPDRVGAQEAFAFRLEDEQGLPAVAMRGVLVAREEIAIAGETGVLCDVTVQGDADGADVSDVRAVHASGTGRVLIDTETRRWRSGTLAMERRIELPAWHFDRAPMREETQAIAWSEMP